MAGGLSGVSRFVTNIKNVSKKWPDNVAKAQYIETQVELKEVIRRTPVDKGPLRASEHVVGPRRERGRRIVTEIVAGGPAAPYAIYVHEDPDALHPVGQWKFIESVLLESRPFMAERIAKRVRSLRVS